MRGSSAVITQFLSILNFIFDSKFNKIKILKGPILAFPNRTTATNDPAQPNYCRSNIITSLYVQSIITLVIAGVCTLIAIFLLILGCLKSKPVKESDLCDHISNEDDINEKF